MDDLRAALGHRVKELREGLGLSQQQLAEQADLDITYISGIERGKRNPGLNSLNQLARALKVPLPALLSDLRQPRQREIRRGRPTKRR